MFVRNCRDDFLALCKGEMDLLENHDNKSQTESEGAL